MMYPVRVPRTWWNTLVDDNGTGNGTIWNKAQIEGQTGNIDQAFAQFDTLGNWYNLPVTAGAFTFGSGSSAMYAVIGSTVLISFNFTACSVPGGTNLLYVTFPTNLGFKLYTAVDVRCAMGFCLDAGTPPPVPVAAQNGQANAIYFTRNDSANWNASANLTYIIGTAIFPISPPALADKEAETP